MLALLFCHHARRSLINEAAAGHHDQGGERESASLVYHPGKAQRKMHMHVLCTR